MAVMEKDTRIFVAVDPGFDSIKVVVNGYYVKFPKEVVDVTDIDESFFVGKKNNTYMKVIDYISGKQHLVGSYAATYLSEQKGNVANGIEESERLHDTFETFKTVEKQILIMSAIAKGLIYYAKESKDNTIILHKRDDGVYELRTGIGELFIGVALPHDAVEGSWSYMDSWLKEKHMFTLETCDATYEVNLDTHRTMSGSQVIASLYGVLTNDVGEQLEEESGVLSENKLPAIVIDGGYLTLGIAHFTSVQLVDYSDSNLQYAMKNINENVAKRIVEETGRQDITSMYVKQIMRKKDHIMHYRGKDGKGSYSLDVAEYVNEETKKVCEELVQSLRDRYDDLLETKSIVITGGTGIAYYEHIKELLSDSDWIDVTLTDYEFYGEKITPDFAIVIGMYKVLHHAVDMAQKKNKSKR